MARVCSAAYLTSDVRIYLHSKNWRSAQKAEQREDEDQYKNQARKAFEKSQRAMAYVSRKTGAVFFAFGFLAIGRSATVFITPSTHAPTTITGAAERKRARR